MYRRPSRLEGGACSGSANGCCGNPAVCGRASSDSLSTIPPPPSSAIPNRSALLMSEPPTTSETIPCDDAWRQIKSHPNVSFADLTLLAEVVARRSKCTGPRVEISPAPGSVTPERGISPPTGALAPFSQQMDSQAIILTDPHAQYHERQRARVGGASSPPQLVPQEVLVRCGRQRFGR
ncbi:hypothetical protein A0H81_00886 [Grifola frondosa]|uniref:Uncharacterized protein n=1 Tax=Grifola frondosa TaxID=5627 RepID=A0A1C7MS87_GRIFR|nr:hypothetical protein A0H81_00886 [Grifola frondosa]